MCRMRFSDGLGGGVKTSLFSMQERCDFGRQRRNKRLG